MSLLEAAGSKTSAFRYFVLLASFQHGLQHALDRISAVCDHARMNIITE